MLAPKPRFWGMRGEFLHDSDQRRGPKYRGVSDVKKDIEIE